MLNVFRFQSQRLVRQFSSYPSHTLLTMPALSPTMTQGNIARWTITEGSEISAGSSICEIETDKATVDYEAQDDGFLAKILLPDGSQNIPCGTIIGVSVEDKDDVAAFANFKPDAAASTSEAPKKETPKPAPKAAEAPKPAAPAPPPAPKAAAPAPKPAPVASKPAPAPTAAGQVFPKMKSPLTALLNKNQSSFESKYGLTMMTRLDAPKADVKAKA